MALGLWEAIVAAQPSATSECDRDSSKAPGKRFEPRPAGLWITTVTAEFSIRRRWTPPSRSSVLDLDLATLPEPGRASHEGVHMGEVRAAGDTSVAEVEKPAPDADEVLVKVLAVSVNPADWHSMRGKPLFSRATLGLLRPKHKILGVDIAGQVEAVGSSVTQFQSGDEVYANLLEHGYGGFAEYVSVPVDVMSLKPASLSFEEAAAVPMAARPPSSGSPACRS